MGPRFAPWRIAHSSMIHVTNTSSDKAENGTHLAVRCGSRLRWPLDASQLCEIGAIVKALGRFLKMSERRSGHRTQWAAQFAVASELCKQGYEVALTMGNHPNLDLMVKSPNHVSFSVDVKGLYKKNYWAVRSKKRSSRIYFYVFAFVPDSACNRFFVLTQAQVNAELDTDRGKARARGRPDDKIELFPGISWKSAEKFEDAWKVLPK
jgi:hypothetical protein